MNYKILSVLLLFFFIGLVSAADSIDRFTVTEVVPLNNFLTIYGKFSGDSGSSGILCSFFLFGTGDNNQLVTRLSDEYTFADGSFSSEFRLTEPDFRRQQDYNVLVCCSSTCLNQTFYIDQTEKIIFGKTADSLTFDLAFWVEGDNAFIVMMVILLIGFIILISFKYWKHIKG